MKRLFKKLGWPLWRMSAPVRRPLIRKFDQHMNDLLSRLLPPLVPPPSPPPAAPANLDLALNSVVRELARLHVQVEILRQQIEDLESSNWDGAGPQSRLSVVGEKG
jgi:hypothetical protein